MLAIFVSQAGRNCPVRLPRKKAEIYVNRFGQEFDRWAYYHDLDPRAAEFFTYDLAVASFADYAQAEV